MTFPSKLGKYQITEALGQGAMGVVYKGFDPDIRRVVALKTIRRDLDDGSDSADSMAARFRNEAQAAGRLQHPGIVAVYDYGEDGQTAFIAMEFVEGNNLSHYLKSQVRFTDDDIHSVICQVLDALEHAHGQGVWHRDIKPGNLIMTRSGRVKIADFGIARIADAGLTRASLMIGTPTHMAPEQFLGGPIDRRVDIYSAGVVLYQLLTGLPPFAGSSEAIMYKVVNEAPAAPSQVEGGAQRPRGYDAIVARALAKDPGQRFASAAEFRAEVMATIGKAVSDTVSDATVVALPARLASEDARRAGPQTLSHGSAGSAPTHWDASVLSQVEAALARHIGAVASVLVRRAARDCSDLPTLYARLAEQVTSASARSAMQEQAARTAGAAPAGAGSGSGAGARSATGPMSGGITEVFRDRAERLLAQHQGPIARVLVKKAAAETTDAAQFVERLAQSISDATRRQKFCDDLKRPS